MTFVDLHYMFISFPCTHDFTSIVSDATQTQGFDPPQPASGFATERINGGFTNGQTNSPVNNGFTSGQTDSPGNAGFTQGNVIGSANLPNVVTARRALLERSNTYMQDVVSEIQTAPIFTETVREAAEKGGATLFSQYGLIAGDAHLLSRSEEMFYYNVAAPSSTFVCGSQGSGKSHTLSCLLENCLFKSEANELPRPLTGIVFHYDTFTSDDVGTACEAAHLASNRNVKVRVLCAPTNVGSMKRTYAGMNINVEPLRIHEQDLNTKRMVDLMSVKVGGTTPLYMHVVNRILRELRIKQQQTPGSQFNCRAFRQMLDQEDLTDHQRVPLDQRLDNLESFMARNQQPGNDWTPRSGQLTVVDLSCPCVTPEGACQLFNICLSLFLEQNKEVGRVVALDEAHKYMNESGESSALTENLLATIRLQRHLAARIIISTQEPTISPKLLDLCSVTIVHRFTSPEWLRALQKHLAGVSEVPGTVNATNVSGLDTNHARSLFGQIVQLRVGEALLFAPSAILRPDGNAQVAKLSDGVLKIRVRKRVTNDGGRSIMAA